MAPVIDSKPFWAIFNLGSIGIILSALVDRSGVLLKRMMSSIRLLSRKMCCVRALICLSKLERSITSRYLVRSCKPFLLATLTAKIRSRLPGESWCKLSLVFKVQLEYEATFQIHREIFQWNDDISTVECLAPMRLKTWPRKLSIRPFTVTL